MGAVDVFLHCYAGGVAAGEPHSIEVALHARAALAGDVDDEGDEPRPPQQRAGDDGDDDDAEYFADEASSGGDGDGDGDAMNVDDGVVFSGVDAVECMTPTEADDASADVRRRFAPTPPPLRPLMLRRAALHPLVQETMASPGPVAKCAALLASTRALATEVAADGIGGILFVRS